MIGKQTKFSENSVEFDLIKTYNYDTGTRKNGAEEL